MAQRARFLREGVRQFLRLPASPALETFGDCGGFSYIRETEPPFRAEEAYDFYEGCGFDYGLSVDHVIPVYRPDFDDTIPIPGFGSEVEKWRIRQQITLDLAQDFKSLTEKRSTSFEPVGVAQGWSPRSCAAAVNELQKMGYTAIALGGMVPLKTPEILEVLNAVDAVRHASTRLHLLGVTRLDAIARFAALGVTSFDSTAPLMRAFKDKSKNYYLGSRTFSAVRVPQVDGTPRFKRRMLAGEVDPVEARHLEKKVLGLLNGYEAEDVDLQTALSAVLEYERLFDPKADRESDYRQVLTDRPWTQCDCAVCTTIGIHVIIFRGAERNRRRGFHNIYQFDRSLAAATSEASLTSSPPIRRAK